MRRDILEKLRKEFLGEEYREEVMVGENSFTLKVLNAGEEAWRDGYMDVVPKIGVVSVSKIVTLAVAIVAINGISVEEIFGDDEGKEENVAGDVLSSGKKDIFKERRFSIAEKMIEFLKEWPQEIIDVLAEKYNSMVVKRREALKNFLKG